jgi:hypothetical protein
MLFAEAEEQFRGSIVQPNCDLLTLVHSCSPLTAAHTARCAACCGIGACAVPPTIE